MFLTSLSIHNKLTFMKKILIILFIFLAAPLPGLDNSPELWKYENNASLVYILGSIHVSDNSLFPMPEEINEAWLNCENLVIEADVFGNPLELQSLILKKGQIKADISLKKLLDESSYKKLSSILSGYGIPIATIENLQPWLIEATLLSLELMKAGLAEEGVDKYFYDKAVNREVPVSYLETALEQFNIMSSVPLELQARSLANSIESEGLIANEMKNLLKAYKSGDTEKINEILSEDFSFYEENDGNKVYEILLTNRNRRWTNKISDYISSGGSYFIVVGAAHVIGTDNIIEMLADRGFQFYNN